MYFNHRILQEAQRPEVPLLERLNFIGIYSNNLDEFFRVRVATLNRIAENDHKFLRDEVAAAKKTLKQISKLYAEYDEEFTRTVDSVFAELSASGIRLLEEDELDGRQLAWAGNFFEENLVGATSPIWMNKVDDLNLIADSAHYLAVSLTRSDGGRTVSSYAVLPIPTGRVGRYHRLPDDADGNACVVALDDILRLMMGKFFVGLDFDTFDAYSFKFTRDAEMEIDNDFNESKMQKVQKGLASHRTREPLRVMYDSEMPRELLVAPNHMRGTLSRLIRTEIANARKGLPAYIRMKINHITDEDMIDLLYKASEAGVQIDIALRGNCSIISGQRGFSENIRICGIIDRYLEHSRILIFANGGQERVFLGSADWMPRNLDHRVEVLAPVHDPVIRDELRRIVDSALADTVQARVVDGSGDNRIRTLADLPEYLDASLQGHAVRSFRSQDELYRHYSEELKCTRQ